MLISVLSSLFRIVNSTCVRACMLSCFIHVWLFCNPMDCSHVGSFVLGIPQARILEWVDMPSCRGSSWPRNQTRVSYVSCIGRQVLYHSRKELMGHLGSPCMLLLSRFSCVQLFATLWTVAHQSPLSMRFSRQEYLSGLPCPPPGDWTQVSHIAGGFFTVWAAREAL